MTCLPCSLEQDGRPETDWVHRDEHWAAGIFPGLEIPGWIVLHSRAHREGWEQLRDRETRRLVGLLPELSRALRAETGTDRVYQVVFGDNHPHFHTLLAPRDPRRAGGPGLLVDPPPSDPALATALAASVRRRLAASAREDRP